MPKDQPAQWLCNGQSNVVSAEISNRKEVLKGFYKQREEFGNQKEYDDHLEKIEDMVFILSDFDTI